MFIRKISYLLMRILGQKTTGLMRIPLAVAVGFEPTVELPQHTLSRRAPLAARTRHQSRGYSN